jgi:sugar O-acyltransferase (sialic acid O-acetyltransferase NeuD family)
MKPIEIPFTDVNTESADITDWSVSDLSEVRSGQVVANAETSKAIIEVRSSHSGFIRIIQPTGSKVAVGAPIAFVFQTLNEAQSFIHQTVSEQQTQQATTISKKALALAKTLGISEDKLKSLGGFVSEKRVKEFSKLTRPFDRSKMPKPLSTDSSKTKLILIGGGAGAQQVIGILRETGTAEPIAILDDTEEKWGRALDEVPIIGPISELLYLKDNNVFDSAVICISTSTNAREKLYLMCKDLGIKLANVVDPTAKIAPSVTMGEGNVICAFVHFGTHTQVGNNNFISAYNSFDHHNKIGSHISSGPGCMTSGFVSIGDKCRLGTGIFVQPKIRLGDNTKVASGAVITSDLPKGASVKLKISTYAVTHEDQK